MFFQFDAEVLVEIAVKMLLALLCGGALGIERQRKKRPAGLRTYILVCVGATLVMMTNQFICETYGTGDPSRMGAQVVSGIGFLGAGTIIVTGHNRVKGLTTAAGLWAAAGVGLAIGIGFYEAAIIGSVMIFVVMVMMTSLDRRITASTTEVILYLEFEKLSALRRVINYIKEKEIKLLDIETESPNNVSSSIAALMTIKLNSKEMRAELTQQISDIKGVTYVEEL